MSRAVIAAKERLIITITAAIWTLIVTAGIALQVNVILQKVFTSLSF